MHKLRNTLRGAFLVALLFTIGSWMSPSNIGQNEIENATEALRCRVVDDEGNVLASCWICNCNKLADEVAIWYPYMHQLVPR